MQRMRRYRFARSALFHGLDRGRADLDQHALRQYEPDPHRRQAHGRAAPDHLLRRADQRRRLVPNRLAQGHGLPRGTRAATRITSSSTSTRRPPTRCGSPDGKGRADTGLWSPDGTKYAFQWTVRNGVASDVYIDDPLDKMAPELVFEAPEVGWNAVDWSPDGKSLLLEHFTSRRMELSLGLRSRDARKAGDRAGEGESRPRRQFLARRQGRVHHFGPRQRVPHARATWTSRRARSLR